MCDLLHLPVVFFLVFRDHPPLVFSEEDWRMGGNVFRPRPTSGKREKQAFGRGRKLPNRKNNVSAMADELKTAKTGFRPRPKVRNR